MIENVKIFSVHITFGGGFEIPVEGSRAVLFHAISFIIAFSHIETAIGVACFCRTHIPLKSDGVIFTYPIATHVAYTKVVHRPRISLEGLLPVGIGYLTFFAHGGKKMRGVPSKGTPFMDMDDLIKGWSSLLRACLSPG